LEKRTKGGGEKRKKGDHEKEEGERNSPLLSLKKENEKGHIFYRERKIHDEKGEKGGASSLCV